MKLGLIINPIAGIGGAAGLKGSDGETIQQEALKRGAVPHAAERAKAALEVAVSRMSDDERDNLVIYTPPGKMGENVVRELGLQMIVVGDIGEVTTSQDTRRIACYIKHFADLLAFAGGDGTARDICKSVGVDLPVIGIPAGVKIHSAVYAVSPSAAGEAIAACSEAIPNLRESEVMDIDEDSYRSGELKTRLYGYMMVPQIRNYMQHPKAASHNSDEDVSGICYEIAERIKAEPDDTTYILGAGSTMRALKKSLGFEGSLLGVDVFCNGKVIANDVSEKQLLKFVADGPSKIVLTVIGGQGHIFGRGNQQLSPRVIRSVGTDNIWVIATGSKLYALDNQQLHVDTGDSDLDEELKGYRKIITGWQEELVLRVL